MWLEKMEKPIIALAPMADYTDRAFCDICRQVAGKDFVVFREMVSGEALVRQNAKTLKMCEFDKSQRPIVLQLFGSDPTVLSKAVTIVNQKFRPDGIDINMGCPVPKITGKVGAGAALLKDHERAVAIIKEIKHANPAVVLSVKTRLGWSKPQEILGFAPKLVEAGVSLLTIHGRTKVQGYSGRADWEMIGRVKDVVTVPVIANGDVNNKADIKNCLQITKADGVMIGRGALGNPWLLDATLTNEQIMIKDKIKTVMFHARLYLNYHQTDSLVGFRKHLVWYFKVKPNLPMPKNFKKIRQALVEIKTISELKDILDGLPN